ncbi:cobalamin B12-binding domain-containing protein [Candidatus Poribacteria bacterium]|nr:cobalamin B12-binding domain-containing protein [Candidatus Poribacteria bacterium]
MTAQTTAPFRALTAVALCDGHDAAIVAVSRALRREGLEVIYLGFNKSPGQIVRAAIDEDADVIGISSYNGGHLEFLADVMRLLRERGAAIPVVAGGGGTITAADTRVLKELGVAEVFPPGMTMWDMASAVRGICESHRARRGQPLSELAAAVAAADRRAIARALTLVEASHPGPDNELDTLLSEARIPDAHPVVVGIAGNGGAGKSTLIDELLLRFDREGKHRVAVVCCDPTTAGVARDGQAMGGALLGDRIRMLSADCESVYIRSVATRHNPGGVSGSLARAVKVLAATPFDVIILESAGIGQADNPFAGLADISVYVMTSEFGSALQLEKTVILESADIVVLNKCDQPAAPAALRGIRARLRSEGRKVDLCGVTAVRHRDPGMDALFGLIGQAMAAQRG